MNPLFGSFALESLQTPTMLAIWVAGLVLGVILLVFTYWGIFARSGRSLAWRLFGLRLAGVVVLFLSLAHPTWVHQQSIDEPAHVVVVLDNSASMGLASDSGKSRYAAAREAIDRLKRALGESIPVDVYDIQGNPLLLSETGKQLSGIPAEPVVERTHLIPAIERAFKSARAKPISGLVIISDGSDNSGQLNLDGLRDLRQRDTQVGIFAIGFPRTEDLGTLDLVMNKPVAPDRVIVNNKVVIEAPITKTGGPEVEATVILKRANEIAAQTKVSFVSGKDRKVARLEFTPSQPGTFVYTATVTAPVAEATLTNNSAFFPLQVDAEPIRILYLEGTMRWEFRYLKAHFEEDPDVNLATVLRRLNPDLQGRPAKDRLTADTLKNVDVLILGDMEGKFLTDTECGEILSWLDQKNHSLLVLGGYQSFGPQGWKTTPLAKALPVTFAEVEPYQLEGGFVPRLTEEGKRHHAFQLGAASAKEAANWDDSTRVEGLNLIRGVKPGATVLAIHPTLKIQNEPAVVACYQNYGNGKTMALLIDTTWHWSRNAKLVGRDDIVYRRFWSQTIRWLAGRQLDERRPLVSVVISKPGYEPGQQVDVTLIRHPRPDVELTNTVPAIEIKGPDGKPLEGQPELHPVSTAPNEFRAVFTASASGKYEVGASLARDGRILGNDLIEFTVQGKSLELADPATRPDILRNIARASGGTFVEIGNEAQIAKQLPQSKWHREWEERHEYWNSPWVLMLFIGCITAEWLIRRRNHMV